MQSTPIEHSAPRRILRRAGNLLTSTGQPAHKELVQSDVSTDATVVEPLPISKSFPRTVRLSASIRRKFKEVKDAASLGRPKSMSVSNAKLDYLAPERKSIGGRGHARSLSTAATPTMVTTTKTNAAPRLPHSISSPPPTTSTIPPTVSTAASRRVSAPVVGYKPSSVQSQPQPPPMDEQGDVKVPQLLQQGTLMTKVSSKKHTRSVFFRLDPDIGHIVWEGKQLRYIPIENIKELRSGSDARYYREQFQLVQEYEDRWLTVIYILDGAYKTLHLIAPTKDVWRMWNTTLRDLHAVRQALMSGLGNIEMRQALWEKQYWKGGSKNGKGAGGAEEEGKGLNEEEQKLGFEEVEKLCRRLNINSSSSELLRLFKQADKQQRNYLDFADFRRFVKLLKSRPEIDRLYKKLKARGGGVFDFAVFEKFMREKQKSSLTPADLQVIFERYSVPPPNPNPSSPSTSASTSAPATRVMTTDTFTSFLMSTDNAAFLDQHGRVCHDMTRPLSDYYVSSSHNTYLVGHQLVGVSTIEGYIRALLHSCRSVELDIFDGETPSEPQIFHGKTFTSKISLREVCRAILKYGFLTSPYPIIISAEIHCSLLGQDAIADIMSEVFGDALVRAPLEFDLGSGDSGSSGHLRLDRLPSPEELKGRILLKAKNMYLASRKDSSSAHGEGEYGLTETSASASSSTSDSDGKFVREQGRKKSSSGMENSGKKREADSNAVKELKDDIIKAGSSVLQRVRSVGKSNSVSSPSSPRAQQPGKPSTPRSNSTQHTQTPFLLSTPKTPNVLMESPGSDSAPPSSYFSPRALTTSPVPIFSVPAYPPTPAPLSPSQRRHSSLDYSISSPLSAYSPRSLSPPPLSSSASSSSSKPKMSSRLLALLVYTVGVKCRGINKKEVYAPEHMFSLSETVANRMLKSGGMSDLIKHCRTHLVRVYPKGMRLSSTNYEPHRYWSAGAQLVAINWQTFDLGYMINHAMFQRNGRTGYVLKPTALLGPAPASHIVGPALTPTSTIHAPHHSHPHSPHPHPHTPRSHSPTPSASSASGPGSATIPPSLPPATAVPKDLLQKHSKHHFDVSIISAQQLPRPKDASGREIVDKSMVDPFVEVSIHVPDWPGTSVLPSSPAAATAPKTISYRTGVVKSNGFNPVWEEKLRIPFECVGDMRDLVFVRFVLRTSEKEDVEPLAVYCASLGSLGMGYRHLPLHDAQLSQYLFSTLFVRMAVTDT